MNPLFERMLSMPPELRQESWTVVLRTTPPTWVLVILALAIIALSWSGYAGLRGSRPVRAMLVTLRAISLGVLVLLLLGPMIEWPRERIERDVVHVLLDRSASLSVRDERDSGGIACTRDEAVRMLLKDPAWAALAREHDVVWHGFASRLVDLPSPDALPAAEGDRTLLASSLEQWLSRIGSRPVAAAILVSDGRSQDTLDENRIRGLRAIAAPIHAIALGDPAGLADRRIDDVEHPQRAFPRDKVPVSVGIHASEGPSIRVALRDRASGVTLDERTLPPDASGTTRVTLMGERTQAGIASWEVVLIQEGGDADPANDRREILVEFIDRPLRVLYLDGWPRWEFRYLKNLLLRETGMESSVMLMSADRDFAQEGTAPLARLPSTEREFAAFDVVIIGDLPGGFMDDARQRILREQVARAGTGLLWIGGPRATPSSWRGTPLEDTLPFREIGEPARWDEPVWMQPTDVALRSGLLQLGDAAQPWPPTLGIDGEPWARLEWVQRIEAKDLKPTVESWATVSAGRGGNATPAVVSMRFGAGTVAYVATDETWRWRHGSGETLPERFWIQMIRHLARQGLRGETGTPSIEVDPPSAVIDQPVRITVNGLGDAKLDQVMVEAEQAESRETIDIPLRPQGAGRFSGAWAPPREGTWTLRAGRGSDWTSGKVSLVVRSEQPERMDTRPDHDMLQRIADATQGRVLRTSTIAGLEKSIPSRSEIVRQPIQRPLWDRWPVYALLVGLLSLEWIGRRFLRLA